MGTRRIGRRRRWWVVCDGGKGRAGCLEVTGRMMSVMGI